MIEKWKSSVESQHSFCKTQGVPLSVFQYWRKKYSDHQKPIHASCAAFVPVHLAPAGSGSPFVELVFADGKRITFYQAVEVSLLRSLLS